MHACISIPLHACNTVAPSRDSVIGMLSCNSLYILKHYRMHEEFVILLLVSHVYALFI